MPEKKIKISIVEDEIDVIEFLTEIFTESDEFIFQQVYKNASEAILFLPRSTSDVVIVDIGLPGQENGIDCVRQVKSLRPDIQFMMYTIFDRGDSIFESLKAGANGYLLKSLDEKKIIASVKEIMNDGAPMSPAIARKVTDFFFKGRGEKNKFKELELLGKREKEVLSLLAKGLLYKEIAEKMGITEGTVKQHIHSIYKKLHVQNRTEAINMYLGRKKDGNF